MYRERRILFVEDDTDTCELIKLVLDDVDVTCVFSYDHALLKIDSQPDFDLFLLDYYLPDATGLELCEAIRERNKNAPIIFLTGSGWLALRDVKESGAQRLIRKSELDFVDQVKSTVHDLLDGRAAKGAGQAN